MSNLTIADLELLLARASNAASRRVVWRLASSAIMEVNKRLHPGEVDMTQRGYFGVSNELRGLIADSCTEAAQGNEEMRSWLVETFPAYLNFFAAEWAKLDAKKSNGQSNKEKVKNG